ncbi:MAG: lipid A biosynthesis (KDO)2-(lauroyl)-lipid IVA acyltransferase [Gammaproteobacteria bacterium]|nr:MAG: lipid A biosynthesis (KDO)2-(lauroyl)-lipid IVA acyltransferase [Gammaproteobacteria bacterium]
MWFARLWGRLPLGLTQHLAGLLYFIVYYLMGYRKAVVYQNLYRAFPEKNPDEIKQLARRFYRHMAQFALEVSATPSMSLQDFSTRMRIKNPELLETMSQQRSRSVIILTVHQGNWEWMLHGLSAHFGVPIDPVYKPLHSETANQWIYDIRSRFGARPLSMDESTRDILRHRKQFRLFAMVADQSPIREERGIWREFLHRNAKFYVGGQALAQVTRFPVVFAQCHKLKNGYYELELHPVAEPPYEKNSDAIIERYIALAEHAIKAQPETWLWTNRRWKRTEARDKYMDAWHAARKAREAAAEEESDKP